MDETNLNLDRGISDFDIPHILSFSYLWRPQWMRTNRWLGGWTFSGITTLQSGMPFTLYSGTNNLTGTDNNRIHDVEGTLLRVTPAERAVQVLGGVPTAALIEPGRGTLGTLGRNTERGDTLLSWNVGLHKDFSINERLRTQLRFEVFNLFNTTNFNAAAVDNVLSVERNADGAAVGYNPNFGRYAEAFSPRSMQIALRFTF